MGIVKTKNFRCAAEKLFARSRLLKSSEVQAVAWGLRDEFSSRALVASGVRALDYSPMFQLARL